MDKIIEKKSWRILLIVASVLITAALVFAVYVGVSGLRSSNPDRVSSLNVITYDYAYYELLHNRNQYKVPKKITDKTVGPLLEETPSYVLFKCKEYMDGPLIIKYDRKTQAYEYYVFCNFTEPRSMNDLMNRYGLKNSNDIRKIYRVDGSRKTNINPESFMELFSSIVNSEIYEDKWIWNQIGALKKLNKDCETKITIELNNGVLISLTYYEALRILEGPVFFYRVDDDFERLLFAR